MNIYSYNNILIEDYFKEAHEEIKKQLDREIFKSFIVFEEKEIKQNNQIFKEEI